MRQKILQSVQDAHRAQPHVEVGRTPTQNRLHPRPTHVPAVQAARRSHSSVVARRAIVRDIDRCGRRRGGGTSGSRACSRQQHDVDARARSCRRRCRTACRRRRREPHRLPHVVGEHEEEDDREIEEVAVDVLDDERERVLAEIALARLADGARRRIRPERLVVGAAIVVTGEPEAARRTAGSAAPARTAARRATTPGVGPPNHACGDVPKSSGE